MNQTALALSMAAFAFMMSLIWGTPFIRALSHFGIHGTLEDGQRSQDRIRVPTLGGILVVVPVIFFSLVLNFADASGLTGLGLSILLPVFTLLAFGFLGVLIDLRGKRKADRAFQRWIFAGQVAFAAAIAYALLVYLDVPEMYFPFYNGEFVLGAWYLPVAAGVILVSAASVRATGGVNGLTAFAGYGAISAAQGQIYITRFCFTLVGALFGFLWFNIKPASLLMGRTGALAIGATLGVIALMTAQWPLLLFIALVPFVEWTSAKLDRLASARKPDGTAGRGRTLHRRLAEMGWSGTQILQRLWLIQLLFAMIGISLSRV